MISESKASRSAGGGGGEIGGVVWGGIGNYVTLREERVSRNLRDRMFYLRRIESRSARSV